jgi:hypothetical protein
VLGTSLKCERFGLVGEVIKLGSEKETAPLADIEIDISYGCFF